MRQGLDIADVETRTKIRAKYLRALENEEFSMLPGSTFVRTFLRTYAEQLGLDAHRLVDEYRARYEQGDEGEPAPLGPPAAMRDRERRSRSGGIGPGGIIALVAVAVIALFVVLGLTGEDDGDGERAGGTDTSPPQRTTTTERERPRRPAPTSVRLRITPSVPTYACVDRGEGSDVMFEGILESARTFRGRRVRVNLGKTSVQLRVNGRDVPIDEGPDPAGFEFTPRRTRPLPLGERPCA